MSTSPRQLASIAVKRFGLGARPGDLDAIASDPRKLVVTLLDKSTASQPKGLQPLNVLYLQKYNWERHLAAMTAASPGTAIKPDDVPLPPGIIRQPEGQRYEEEVTARLKLAFDADVALVERLVWFWANHFAVGISKNGWMKISAGAFEREVIRPNVLGRFSDMLLASTRHYAMLHYLDNIDSVGPHSETARLTKENRGLNENLSREILELHTLGVGGGYGQADVDALARMLTGWTANGTGNGGRHGDFLYSAAAHEPGTKEILGKSYPDTADKQAVAALIDIARHPSTARHIAFKLARHFVADDPPTGLVEELSRVFIETDGDLKQLALTLVASDQSWDAAARKLRTPQEFLLASLRATGVRFETDTINQFLRNMGNRFWDPPAPNGFPDTAAAWLSPANFRARFDTASEIGARYKGSLPPKELALAILGDDVSRQTLTAIERAESAHQGVAIMLMAHEFQRR